MKQLGSLAFESVAANTSLLASTVQEVLASLDEEQATHVLVAAIDPKLADTAAFCETYNIGLDVSANCVVVKARRAEKTWYAACMILATEQADVNGVIRRHLGARKISFASMDDATSLTGMEYGGITPIGLPEDWVVLIDEQVMQHPHVVIGSGVRHSKLLVPPQMLLEITGGEVLPFAKS